MLEAALKLLGEQAVAAVIEKMSERLSLGVEVSAEQLLESVLRVDSKVEQQLLTSLRAGVTFLRLGERDLAVAEFVRAEAADKAAAAPCVWLGLALALIGRETEAARFMIRGLTLNPYILHCMAILKEDRPR